jgi:hypothetical protein
MESFQPLDRASRIFNIDTEEFRNYLENNNFTIYNNIFSNTGSTLSTIYDILTFRPLPIMHIKPNSDISSKARDIISGTNSILFDTFKANGYMIELFVPLSYINRTTFNLDVINHDISSSMYLTAPFTILSNITLIRRIYSYEELEDSLIKRINTDHDKPIFMFIKSIGALHVPSYNYNWLMASSWIKSGIYQYEYVRAIKSMRFIIDQIISKDPNAWIILMGDHGPSIYFDILDKQINKQEDIEQIIRNNNITLEEFIEDSYAIILAIRSPKVNNDLSKGFILDPRNLFLHVFAELSGDENLLKMRFPVFTSPPNRRMTPLIDGKINPNWFENPYLPDDSKSSGGNP